MKCRKNPAIRQAVQSLLLWERGLKSWVARLVQIYETVAPLVGAWIEMVQNLKDFFGEDVAPLVGAWIEIGDGYGILDS